MKPRALTPAQALGKLVAAHRGGPGERPTLHRLAMSFLHWLEARNHPETTRKSYGDALGAFLTYTAGIGVQFEDEMTVMRLDGFFVYLHGRGAAPSTIAHRRAALISFWRWLEHGGFAARNLARITYPIRVAKRLPRYLEPHEIDTLLGKLAELTDLRGQRDHAMIATLFYAGVRVAELATLRLEDVDLTARRIRVNKGKGAKDRILVIPPRLLSILARYVQETRPALLARGMGCVERRRPGEVWRARFWTREGREVSRTTRTTDRTEAERRLRKWAPQPAANPWLFVNAGRGGHRLSREGQPLLTRSIYPVVRERARQFLGVKLGPHGLRHTCASHIIRFAGEAEGLRIAQRVLGHADVRTTMVYIHVPRARHEEEIARIFGEEPEAATDQTTRGTP